jgi:hypothetical protein
MAVTFRLLFVALLSGAVLTGLAAHASATETPDGLVTASLEELPDSPTPQVTSTAQEPQATSGQVQSTQSPTEQAGAEANKHQKADAQIKQQTQQRMLGIIPSFNTSYVDDAVSMTPGQKFRLAFRTEVDPYSFAVAPIVAGFDEINGDDSGFGWGAAGFGKHAGAAYLDGFSGNMIGNALLPVILHQDPRYFRLGHGSGTRRLYYAISRAFICKHDNTGKWEPNYSNIGGNLAAGALSNLYYPDSKSALDQMFEAGLTVTVTGTIGSAVQEFWPDIARKIFHKDPTNGMDAQARAADEAKKKAKTGQ